MCAVGTRRHAIVATVFAHIFDNFHAVHRVGRVLLCPTCAVSRGRHARGLDDHALRSGRCVEVVQGMYWFIYMTTLYASKSKCKL